MRTRIVIAFVLAVGLVSGPAAAVAQISDSGQAAEVQYPELSAPREESSGDGDLPVTGFVAIPLVITGAMLLLVGGVMHIRTRRE